MLFKKRYCLMENESDPIADYDWKLRHLRDQLNSIEALYANDQIPYEHYIVAKHNIATEMGNLALGNKRHLKKLNTKFEIK